MLTSENRGVWYALVFGAIFTAGCIVNSIGIGFPIIWHPDELSKAVQIQTGRSDFFHPQLLLLLTKAVKSVLHLDDAPRTIVLTGRFVSLTATAAAVTTLAIVVARRFGILFGLITAMLVGLTPTVFVNGHFFKEDALLLLGCSLVVLALQTFDLRPTRTNAMLLGSAVGIACSAKYVGALMLIPMTGLIAKRAGWRDVLLALGSAISIFATLNAAGIFGTSSLLTGLMVELRHVTSSHSGVQFGPTSAATVNFFLRSTTTGVVLLWLGGLLYCSWNVASAQCRQLLPQRFSLFEAALYLIPLLFLLAIQMSMAVLPRYLMPVAAMVTLAAVWTVARLVSDERAGVIGYLGVVLLVVGALATMNSFAVSATIFADAPRARIAKWISSNLPPTSKLAADFYSGIPDRNYVQLDPTLTAMPLNVEIIYPVPGDNGLSIDGLRSAGFTHVVTAGGNYDRLFDPAGKIVWPAAERRRQYYEDVFAKLKLLYEQPARTDLDDLFDARIAVYDLKVSVQPRP